MFSSVVIFTLSKTQIILEKKLWSGKMSKNNDVTYPELIFIKEDNY